MGIFRRFERGLEGLVTGAFARVFRSAVQPVEIAAALQRELDNSAQIMSRESSLVPNDFVVELAPADHERLAPYTQQVSAELTEAVTSHAGTEHYTFTGPIRIRLELRKNLSTGRFRVTSSVVAGVTPAGGSPRRQPPAGAGPLPYLEVGGVRHQLTPPGVVLGRGSEADLRITDPGVSRRHAEIRVAWSGHGYAVSVHDLGSTNATVVNGQRVHHAELADGAQILLGNTLVVLRQPSRGGGGR